MLARASARSVSPASCLPTFTVGGLGLIGMPLTSGFISKWYLIQGAFDAGLWWVVFVVLVGSLLALIYVWRVIEAIYFEEPEVTPPGGFKEAPISMLVPTWILIGASIYFGLDASLAAETARAEAVMLLGGYG